jgi:hypothetical protein
MNEPAYGAFGLAQRSPREKVEAWLASLSVAQ